MRFEVQHVDAMPAVLAPGVLYVSLEFETAHHLCACGCGMKVRTPLGPAEWQVDDDPQGVTVHPSIGNWQFPCRSHYLIRRGQVVWSEQWSDARILAGRKRDQERLQAHLDAKAAAKPTGWWSRVRRWIGL